MSNREIDEDEDDDEVFKKRRETYSLLSRRKKSHAMHRVKKIVEHLLLSLYSLCNFDEYSTVSSPFLLLVSKQQVG